MAKNTSTRNKERREEALRDLDRELRVRDRAEKSKPLGVAAASVLVIVAIVGGIWWAANQNGDDKNTDQQAQNSTSATPDPAANTQPLATARTNPLPETVNCTYTPEGQAAREVSVPPAENIPATGTVTVTLNTNAGPIGMTLDRAVSPCTVNAVQHLAANNFYNDTICHRMTSEGIHVLQCGDPSGSGSGGPGFKFPNEYPTDEAGGNATQPVNYKRGTIAMATPRWLLNTPTLGRSTKPGWPPWTASRAKASKTARAMAPPPRKSRSRALPSLKLLTDSPTSEPSSVAKTPHTDGGSVSNIKKF